MADQFDDDIKAIFLEEETQCLAEMEQSFLDLEKSNGDLAVIEKIFRYAHSLKGSARACGFMDIGEFTHTFEHLLLRIKEGQVPVRKSTIDLLLRCHDHIKHWIDALKKDSSAKVESMPLLKELQRHIEGGGADQEPQSSQSNGEPDQSSYSSSSSHGQKQAFIEIPTGETTHTESTQQNESIRVAVTKVDKLLNNVGELVILQTVLNQQKNDIQNSLLQKTIDQLNKIAKNIQDITMSLRMVPVKHTFLKMQRVVRDTSQMVGKEVQLLTFGEDTELDKNILDQIGDPLVHLIRNAVDHGIESAQARSESGKPAIGTISLAAFHKGSYIVLEVRDDGGGIDHDAVVMKAIEKGILSSDLKLSRNEAYQLLFAPGFSTRVEVTEVSGRGVGLDVVKSNIQQLQGTIEVESEIGTGTVFRLMIPLTLAIIDGMVVRVGEERYVIPLSSVAQSVQPAEKDVQNVNGLGEILNIRGENLPLYRLNRVLGRKVKAVQKAEESIAIVLNGSKTSYSVLVDDIVGRQQVVIKRLGSELKNTDGISGSAILGDGRPALILDPDGLARRMA